VDSLPKRPAHPSGSRARSARRGCICGQRRERGTMQIRARTHRQNSVGEYKDNVTLVECGIDDGTQLEWQLVQKHPSRQTERDTMTVVIARPDGRIIDIRTVDRSEPVSDLWCVSLALLLCSFCL
jgi:hypothetical protein